MSDTVKLTMSNSYTEHGQTLEAGETYKVTGSMARHLIGRGFARKAAQNSSFAAAGDEFTTTTAERLEAPLGGQTPAPAGSGDTPESTDSAKTTTARKK